MIDLSKIKQHKGYTRIFIPRTVTSSVLITLRLNHDKNHQFYRYSEIPEGIDVPQVQIYPDSQLKDPKPGMLVSHYDPDEFTALLWDMNEDKDVIEYQTKLCEEGAKNFETCYKSMKKICYNKT